MKNLKKVCLVLLILFCVGVPVAAAVSQPVQVEAASKFTGWKQRDGYWYYYEKGKRVSGWKEVNGKWYYMDPATYRMRTGIRKIGKYYYSLDATGARRENKWVKNKKGQWYYFKENGRAVANDWHKSNGKYYWFESDAKMVTGFHKINKKTYYFNPKETVENKKKYPEGCMRTGWVKINSKWYAFKSTGVMRTGWYPYKGKKYYLLDNGVMKTGWQTIDKKKYYFNLPNGDMAVNITKLISGKTYVFDANGISKELKYTTNSSGEVLVYDSGRRYTLKKEYLTHPGVASGTLSDAELLKAVVYCEAGDQGLAGMTAVALTILNRVESADTYYPDTLKYVIYQKGQYAVVNDGSLARRLKNPRGETYSTCSKAVTNAMNIMTKYQKNGTRRVISGFNMGSKKDFDCLFFMTRGAFNRLGLSWSRTGAFQFKDHVFFSKWSY